MLDYLIAVGVILVVLLGWTRVQQLGRNFAARHPEYGPPPEEGTGCGSGCMCSGSSNHCKSQGTRSTGDV